MPSSILSLSTTFQTPCAVTSRQPARRYAAAGTAATCRVVEARAHIEAYLADTPPSQRALKFFDWVVAWAESKDFRGCPLQHTVSELTDAAHPARAIAHDQRPWFAERLREWTTTAGVKDSRVRSCGYKQKHWTIQSAGAHLDSIRRRFGQRTDRLTIYRCRHCGAWHVGRYKPPTRH